MTSQNSEEFFAESLKAFDQIEYKPLRLDNDGQDPDVSQRMVAMLLDPRVHQTMLDALYTDCDR